MKALVELYDSSPMKNMAAVLHFKPENLIYLYDEAMDINRLKDFLYRLLRSKKIKVRIEFIKVKSRRFEDMTALYGKLLTQYGSLAFDFTGGDELMLLSAGIFCRNNSINCFYIDFKEKCLINYFENSKIDIPMPSFLVRDVIGAFGGSLLRSDHYHPPMENREMVEDILKVFGLVKRDVNRWNRFIKYMQRVLKNFNHTLEISVKDPLVFNELVYCDYALLTQLQELGIIHNLSKNKNLIGFTFKNEVLRELHRNQGVWLELFCYICAKESNYFDDVVMSAIIDWDGREGPQETTNEIDLILTKGVRPIFISCKISEPNALALSEIKFLSKKFGGETACAVIVTAYDLSGFSKATYQRAKEMNVKIIELSDLKKERTMELLKSIGEDDFQYKF